MSKKLMFVYLGRRGFSRFVLNVIRAAIIDQKLAATVIISRQNERHESFLEFGSSILSVDTFSKNSGAILNAWRLPLIRSKIRSEIIRIRPDVIIELMPHVWSSFIFSGSIMKHLRYMPVIHDYRPHLGDHRSASVNWFLKRALLRSDKVFTLSHAVASHLNKENIHDKRKIVSLFHPDLDFGVHRKLESPPPRGVVRLLFFGRIMRYKGLEMFLDMVDQLRNRGISVDISVIGEGDLRSSLSRLSSMGAEVINRWLSDTEIGYHLPRFHAVVLSHVEASQSGVAAAALGAGIPVVATPVGGIVEQIIHGETGLIARRADAVALAEAVEAMISSPGLYDHICRSIDASREDRSVGRFVQRCVELAFE